MDIELLKTFLEVARIRHFGKASDNLFLTQSAVSARIRLLEDSIGAPLFVRKRNDIHLTPTGEKLIPYAQSVVTLWNRARQYVLIPNDAEDVLSVSSVIGLWDIILQQWLEKLHTSPLPLIIHADISSADTMQRKLQDSTLDIAFTFETTPSYDLQIEQIACIPLILVTSKPNLTPELAFENNFIFVDWGTSFNTEVANIFMDAPSPRMRVSVGKIAQSLITNHGGTAYLAEPCVRDAINEKQLFIVNDAPTIERCAYAVFNPESEHIDIIKQCLLLFEKMSDVTFPDMSIYQ